MIFNAPGVNLYQLLLTDFSTLPKPVAINTEPGTRKYRLVSRDLLTHGGFLFRFLFLFCHIVLVYMPFCIAVNIILNFKIRVNPKDFGFDFEIWSRNDLTAEIVYLDKNRDIATGRFCKKFRMSKIYIRVKT